MPLLYEDVFSPASRRRYAKTPEVWVHVSPPPAEEYERVHFIGHALYAPKVTTDQLMGKALDIETEIENRTGYRVYIVDIKIRHYPPLMTDVDFIMDVPVTSPLAPLVAAVIIVALAAVIVFLVWLCWDTYVEKVKKYTCPKCPDLPPFVGWLELMAHKEAAHPDQYKAIMDAKGTDWWVSAERIVKWVAAGLIVATVTGVALELVRRRR